MNKKFLYDVIEFTERYCGQDITRELIYLRRERERILNNIWKREPLPEALSAYHKEIMLRNIDFETIISYIAKHLKSPNYVELLNIISDLAIKHGEFCRAKDVLHIILKIVGKEDQSYIASILKKIGNVEIYLNNFKAAHKIFNKSLEIYNKIEEREGIVSIKNYLGAILVEEGKFYEGEIYLIQARKMADDLHLSEMSSKINMNIGNIYNMRGLTSDAIKCYQKALSANQERDKELISNVYMNFAITYKFMHDYDKASEYIKKAQDVNKETSNRYQRGLVYLTKAELACLQGELSLATAFVTSAFAIFSEIGDRLSIAEAYKILGMVNRLSKNFDIALSYFENSKRIYEMITNPINLAETLVEMAKLYVDMGDKSLAKKVVNKAIKNFQKIGGDRKVEYTQSIFRNLL